MPIEIKNINDFLDISEKAGYCMIKRLNDVTKLKVRFHGRIYTIKIENKNSEEIIRKIKCKTTEV